MGDEGFLGNRQLQIAVQGAFWFSQEFEDYPNTFLILFRLPYNSWRLLWFLQENYIHFRSLVLLIEFRNNMAAHRLVSGRCEANISPLYLSLLIVYNSLNIYSSL